MSIERTAPTGWGITKLEDVVDILDNKRVPVNAKERETRVGQVPYYGATGQVGWIDDYLFDEELVLLGEDGAPFLEASKQKAYMIRGKSWVNNHVHVLKARSDIPNAYIKYYLDTVDYHEFVTGTTRLKLNQAAMRRIPIPLAPLEERARIVVEIEKQFSRLDEAVATLKRVKANLKRYKAAVLKAAVEGKLTEDWRKQHFDVEPASKLLERTLAERRAKWNRAGNYKEPAAPDTTGLPLLPNNWKWASLDQLLLNITDGDHQPPPQTDSGVPFLVIRNVRSGKLEFEDTRFVSRQYADAVDAFRKPTHDDILYTLVGSFGIALRVDTDREFCIQRHIGVLRPHKLSPTSYLVHVLNSLAVLSQAIKVATGTAQKTVPLAGLRKIAIPLAPLAEQQQIVAEAERRLSVIEELETAVQANLTRADRLRQSTLATAFSGRLLSRQNNEV
jgi:type I restriction enzyme S subunit